MLDQTSEFQLQQQLHDVEAQLASQEGKNRALVNERDLLAKYVYCNHFVFCFAIPNNL